MTSHERCDRDDDAAATLRGAVDAACRPPDAAHHMPRQLTMPTPMPITMTPHPALPCCHSPCGRADVAGKPAFARAVRFPADTKRHWVYTEYHCEWMGLPACVLRTMRWGSVARCATTHRPAASDDATVVACPPAHPSETPHRRRCPFRPCHAQPPAAGAPPAARPAAPARASAAARLPAPAPAPPPLPVAAACVHPARRFSTSKYASNRLSRTRTPTPAPLPLCMVV